MTRALLDVLGRFHPLLLHLPIGLLAALAFCEARAIVTNRPTSRALFSFFAHLSAAFAVVSAATGLLLARNEDVTDTLYWHRALGIAVAVASIVLVLQARARPEPISARGFGPERFWLGLTLGLLVPAGHLGATLTHGEDFLFAPLRARSGASSADSVSYAAIEPLLAKYCYECHGESRKKGGLQLHTREAIEKGGRHGPVLVVGSVTESKLVDQMRMPLAYEHHMPPEGEPQPTPAEIDSIAAWVAAGAPFGDASAKKVSSEPSNRIPSETAAIPTPMPPDADAIDSLRSRLVHVEATALGDSSLIIDFASIADRITDADVSILLEPLAPNIVDLSLARCGITDATLLFVAKLPRLERLDLRGTKITPAGLVALAQHPALSELGLAMTALDDTVESTLLAIPRLERVHCWKSGITDYAIAKLRKDRPNVVFDSGDGGPTEPVEVEPTVELGKSVPPPTTNTPDALAPVNQVCPVSGADLDPKFRIVFEGRVIGFCCDKCLAKFLADPAAFQANLK